MKSENSDLALRANAPMQLFFLLICAALSISIQAWPAERWSAVISPDNSLEYSFVKDQALVGRLGLGGWGPNWQWVGLTPPPGAPGERILTTVPFVVNQARGEVIEIGFQAAKTGPRQVAFSYRLSAAKDVPITMLIASLSIDKAFGRGQLRLTYADGQKSERPLPFGRGTVPATSNLVLHFEKGGDLALGPGPALSHRVRRRYAHRPGFGDVQGWLSHQHAHGQFSF